MNMDAHTEACLQAMLDKKQMQVLHIGGGWQDEGTDTVLTLLGNEHYRANVRIKPQVMCEMAGVQYPMPMSAKPANGDEYYAASPQGVDQHTWRNDDEDLEWLDQGASMTIVIPDVLTPKGTKCWGKNVNDQEWVEGKFIAFNGAYFVVEVSELAVFLRQCRLDDPIEGWVENTGTAPDLQGLIDLKMGGSIVTDVKAASWNWDLTRPSGGRITHWRYPRTETKEQPMTPHPQADILRRIADGENLEGRVWSFSNQANCWIQWSSWAVLINHEPNYVISDEPGVPPPLPRKMIQLRKDGPWYYQGETVAPGDDVMVWCIWHLNATAEHSESTWKCWDNKTQAKMLRLGLVHLSEENYRLHMTALEDLMLWAHEQGGVK
jgi:hypothetical protein